MLGALAFVPWIPWAWLRGQHVTAGVLLAVVHALQAQPRAGLAVAPLAALHPARRARGIRGSASAVPRRRRVGGSPGSAAALLLAVDRRVPRLPRVDPVQRALRERAARLPRHWLGRLRRALRRRARVLPGGGALAVPDGAPRDRGVRRASSSSPGRVTSGPLRLLASTTAGDADPHARDARVHGVLVPPPPDARVPRDAHGATLRRRARREIRRARRLPSARRSASPSRSGRPRRTRTASTSRRPGARPRSASARDLMNDARTAVLPGRRARQLHGLRREQRERPRGIPRRRRSICRAGGSTSIPSASTASSRRRSTAPSARSPSSFSSPSASSTSARARQALGRVRRRREGVPRRGLREGRRGVPGVRGLEAPDGTGVVNARDPQGRATSPAARSGRRAPSATGCARAGAGPIWRSSTSSRRRPPAAGTSSCAPSCASSRAAASTWSSSASPREPRRVSSTRSTSTSSGSVASPPGARGWCTASTARSAPTGASTTAPTSASPGSTPSWPPRRSCSPGSRSRSTASSGSSFATRSSSRTPSTRRSSTRPRSGNRSTGGGCGSSRELVRQPAEGRGGARAGSTGTADPKRFELTFVGRSPGDLTGWKVVAPFDLEGARRAPPGPGRLRRPEPRRSVLERTPGGPRLRPPRGVSR